MGRKLFKMRFLCNYTSLWGGGGGGGAGGGELHFFPTFFLLHFFMGLERVGGWMG